MTTTTTTHTTLVLPNDSSSLFHSSGSEFYSPQIRGSNNNLLFVSNTNPSKSEKTNGDFCMPSTKSTIKLTNDNSFNQMSTKQLSVVYTSQMPPEVYSLTPSMLNVNQTKSDQVIDGDNSTNNAKTLMKNKKGSILPPSPPSSFGSDSESDVLVNSKPKGNVFKPITQ